MLVPSQCTITFPLPLTISLIHMSSIGQLIKIACKLTAFLFLDPVLRCLMPIMKIARMQAMKPFGVATTGLPTETFPLLFLMV